MLSIKNLCKSYYDNEIFENINIELGKGEVCAIIGKSGCGKTTLFNILAGFEDYNKGEIYLKNKNISYMQQKHLLLNYMNVFDNISLQLKIKKVPKKEINFKVEEALKQFGLWKIKDKYPHQISGGMKQRVSFIRAYLKSKDLILLDEPFSSLDNITKFEIYNWFYEIIKKEKITVLFITHDIQEAILMSNKVYIMDKNIKECEKTIFIKNNYLKLSDFLNSKEFHKYYNKIFNLIIEKNN